MKNRSFRRWLTLVLVLAMLLGILPAVAAADASLSDYAPAGTTNLAVGATLTVSNGTHNAMGQENSYEMPSEHWSKDFVHDGDSRTVRGVTHGADSRICLYRVSGFR